MTLNFSWERLLLIDVVSFLIRIHDLDLELHVVELFVNFNLFLNADVRLGNGQIITLLVLNLENPTTEEVISSFHDLVN